MAAKMYGSFNKIFDDQKFRVISRNVMSRFGTLGLREALTQARNMCPVGSVSSDPPDPHSGLMKKSIYGKVDDFPESVRIVVAIANPPVDYAKPVIFGSRNHKPNNFMLRARNATVRYLKRVLKENMGAGPTYWQDRNERNLMQE